MAWTKKTKKIVIYVVAAIAASVGLSVGIFYAVKKLGPKSTSPPEPEPEPEPAQPSGEYFCVAVDDDTPLPPCTRSDGSVVPLTECTCRFQCRD